MIDQLTNWLHAYLMNNDPQVTPRGLAAALLGSFQVSSRRVEGEQEKP